MNFICLFLPPLVMVLVYEKISGSTLSIIRTVQYYALFNILNNIIIFGIKYFILNSPIVEFSIAFCLKYLILSLVNILILPLIISFFEKNIEVRLNVKKND